MTRRSMIVEIRYSLDYIRGNLYDLGPQLWNEEERDRVRDLVSKIRFYINDKYAEPSLSWVYKKIVGTQPIGKMFSDACWEKEGTRERRTYPQIILDRLEAAIHDFVPKEDAE